MSSSQLCDNSSKRSAGALTFVERLHVHMTMHLFLPCAAAKDAMTVLVLQRMGLEC